MSGPQSQQAGQPQPPDDLQALLVVQAATLLTLEAGSAYTATYSLRRALEAFRRLANRRWLLSGVSPVGTVALSPRVREHIVQELVLELRHIATGVERDVPAILRQEAERALRLGVEHAAQQIGAAVEAVETVLDETTRRVVDSTGPAAADQLLRAAAQIERAQTGADLQTALATADRSVATVNTGSTYATNQAANEGTRRVAVARGERLLWIAERNACVVCLALAGHVIDPNSGEGFDELATYGPYAPPEVWPPGMPLMQPPRHPHCLPGDALVTAGSRITGATSRIYDGELVEIRTLSQKVFTATPNHPVLTDRGWVPIGSIDQGSYVVGAREGQRVLVTDNDDQYVPARIQDVAEAFLRSRQVLSVEVPLAAEDFHGDGRGSKVAVVGADRFLRHGRHASVCEQHSEVSLQLAGAPGSTLVVERARDLLLGRDRLSTATVMRRAGQPGALFGARGGHARVHAFAAVAGLDSGFEQYSADRPAADTVGFGERLLARTGEVELDQVVSVRRYPFRGHVYNLETVDGWYIGNGIVTHNCRCQVSVWLGSLSGQPDLPERLKHEAARSVLKGWSLPSESNTVRLQAARALLRRGGRGLPKSVQEEAARAVARGRFTSRTVPQYQSRKKEHTHV